MQVRKALTVLLVLTCLQSPTAATAATITHAWPADAKQIEAAMARMGLPVGPVDGTWDFDTARATCAWRELTGRDVLRSWPIVSERRAVKATTAFTIPAYLRDGVNIDVQCQTAVWVVNALVESSTVHTRTVTTDVETVTASGETTTVPVSVVETYTVTRLVHQRSIERVMPVSTGQAGYSTKLGSFRVQWTVNRWWQSTIYRDGLMYRPMFFNGGQALHGSIKDSLVHTYPASHGCVRMLHADVDALWDAGFGRGDRVYVYGTWKG